MNIAKIEKENKKISLSSKMAKYETFCRLIIGATGLIGRSLSKSFVDENTFLSLGIIKK